MQLLRHKFEDSQLWRSFQPYWQSLPAIQELFGMYAFEKRHVQHLQDAQLVQYLSTEAALLHCLLHLETLAYLCSNPPVPCM